MMQDEFDEEMRKLGVEREGLDDALESAKSKILGEESGHLLGKG
jgi:hypothetical protein